MADGIVEIIRSSAVVDRDNAIRVFRLLLPLVEAGPSESDAAQAAGRVIARMQPTDTLAAVLDWWLAVNTGVKPPLQLAYHLPDEITGDLREAMEALVRLGTPIPPAQWLAARQELAERIEELGRRVELDFYGASKLPGERDVWASLRTWAEPVIETLRRGVRSEPFELDAGRFERAMKHEGISPGSRRWREMRKRADQLEEFLNETVAVQADAMPWIDRDLPPGVAGVPEAINDALAPLGADLLRPVLGGSAELPAHRPDGTEPGGGTDQSTAALLRDAASETDDNGHCLLATLAAPWMRSRDPIEPLADMLERRAALEAGITRLRDAGHDVDEIDLALLDHDITEAERLYEEETARVNEDRRAEQLRRRVDHLRQVAADVEQDGEVPRVVPSVGDEQSTEPPAATERLDTIARLIDSGDLRDATAMAREVEADLQRLSRDAVTRRASDAVAVLERLRAPASLVSEKRAELARLEGDPHAVADPRLAEDLNDLVDQLTARRRADLDRVRHEARALLDEIAPGLPADDVDQLEFSLDALPATPAPAELCGVLDDALAARDEIQRRRVHRWDAGDGESELVEHLVRYCTQEMHFARQDVVRLYAAVKTKPFVILAGLTGSGKSTLARLVAEAFGATLSNGGFRRVAVHPDWIDQSEVLGHVHPMSNRFIPGWLAEVARDCERNPDRLFVVLLDEMNLAPVEQYLAEYLSAVEELRSGGIDVRLPLYPRGTAPDNEADWPHALPLPANLWVIGTVNVDETTRALSERVLDRANVIQLSVDVSDAHHHPRRGGERPWAVPYGEWRTICSTEPSDGHHDFLVDLAVILKQMGIGVGARAHIELERFLANADGVLDEEDALDLGVLQRIVPKIRGFKRDLVDGLEQLHEEFEATGCQRCARVVDRWLDDRVSDDDYIDGTDARIALVA